MTFEAINTTKITSKHSTSTDKISIDGITAGNITPEYAAEQINKLLNIIGLSVVTTGMTRTITQEATDNG